MTGDNMINPLLNPFYNILNKYFPDFNTKRATDKNPKKRQFIYPSKPENYKLVYPIISLDFAELKPNYIYDIDENKTISYEGKLNIHIWCKKGEEYICDDNIKRKNEAFLEYIKMNHLWRILTFYQDEVYKSDYIESYYIEDPTREEYTEAGWLLNVGIGLRVFGKVRYDKALNPNGYIKEIDINIS